MVPQPKIEQVSAPLVPVSSVVAPPLVEGLPVVVPVAEPSEVLPSVASVPLAPEFESLVGDDAPVWPVAVICLPSSPAQPQRRSAPVRRPARIVVVVCMVVPRRLGEGRQRANPTDQSSHNQLLKLNC